MAAIAAGWLVAKGQAHRAAAATAAVVLGAAVLRNPRAAMVGLIGWLAVLGGVRRILAWVTGTLPAADPLLLAGPAAVGVLAVVAIRRGGLRSPTPLTRSVEALAGLAILGVLNPLQGGLAVGLAGLLFTLAPMLWFPIGRALADDRILARTYAVVGGLAVAAALYGVFQVLAGFPVYDQRWIERAGYVALNVRGTIRPFSFFPSGAEYATFVAIGLLAYWVPRGRRAGLGLGVLAVCVLLVVAVVLQGSRGIVVTGVASLGLVAAARRGLPAGQALVVGLLAVLALFAGVDRFAPEVDASTPVGSLLAHQVGGLGDPLNPAESTARIHTAMVVNGTSNAFRNPIGLGTGAITSAGQRFGGTSASAEADPGNAGLAWGIPGLIAYLALAVTALPRAYRLAQTRRDLVAVGALSVLLVTFLQWLNGGQYTVAALVWLTLGWVDRAADVTARTAPAGRRRRSWARSAPD